MERLKTLGGGKMERLSSEELDAIRARAEKATASPWEVCNGTDVFTPLGATNNAGVTANHNDGWYIAKCNEGSTSVGDEEVDLSFSEQTANSHFIAHAREDVPKLLAEVERYRYALESIVNIDGMFIDDGFDVEKAYDVIDEIARKAIGGDSDD